MTRMWCLPTEEMCDQHILGEHKELHQLLGHIRAGNKNCIKGHADLKQIDTSRIEERHTELRESGRFKAQSPIQYDGIVSESDGVFTEEQGSIDIEANREDLAQRCEDCKKRIKPKAGR